MSEPHILLSLGSTYSHRIIGLFK